MSQITREINKITGTIIGISGKLIIYALLILLLVEGISKGYAFGHEIFYATAVSPAPGRDTTVTIGADSSSNEVADTLYKMGLINNQYAFVIQKYFYDYDINPGTYVLNTSMTSKDILALFHETTEETEETKAPAATAAETVSQLSEDGSADDDWADEGDDLDVHVEVEP